VAQTLRTTRTRCCHILTTPSLPTNLFAGSPSGPLTIGAPLGGITVRLTARYYASIPQFQCSPGRVRGLRNNATTLAFTPSANLTFNASTSQAFGFFTATSGCYLIGYVIGGSRASSYFLPSNATIFVLSSESVVPAPSLSTVKFSSSGSQLLITFSAPTNTGGYTGSFACARLVSFRGAATALCSWTSNAALQATLGRSAVVVPGALASATNTGVGHRCIRQGLTAEEPLMLRLLLLLAGNNLTILASQLRARCPATSQLCGSYPFTPRSNATIQSPDVPLLPSISLTYPSTISTCGTLRVDASGTTGSGGRPMYFLWSVTSVSGANTTALQKYLDSINPAVSMLSFQGSRKSMDMADLAVQSLSREGRSISRHVSKKEGI
jgi:hypothetical protein